MNSAPRLILYAEDDENDAFFMERAFAKLRRRCALRIVPTGRQVVDYLDGVGAFRDRIRFPIPALIILDVKLPEMTGLEVLHWIRTRQQFMAMAVVMFTSSTQDADIGFSRQHRANAYLVKPSSADQLVLLVDELLDALPPAAPGAPLPVTGNMLLEMA